MRQGRVKRRLKKSGRGRGLGPRFRGLVKGGEERAKTEGKLFIRGERFE